MDSVLVHVPCPGGLALLTGVAVAWARVFLGVHFPLDMLGAVVVAGVAYMVIAPLWHLAGGTVTRCVIAPYPKLLARPIALG